MYAVIRDRGRQYKVTEGDEFDIPLNAALEAGGTVTFSEVLCCGTDGGVKVGSPLVAGAKVTAEVVGVVRGPKLVIRKLRRRKNSRRKTGHRQDFSRVRVTKITA